MATNMTFTDFVTPVPADWLNNVNTVVNNVQGQPYTPGFTGSINRTIQAKLKDWVSVLDFGADPTGATDSTSAMQSAHNTGRVVYYPAGTYSFTTITMTAGGILGDGPSMTFLNTTDTSTADIIKWNGAGGSPLSITTTPPIFQDFRVSAAVNVKTSGGLISIAPPSGEVSCAIFENLLFNGGFNQIQAVAASHWRCSNCVFINYTQAGVLVQNTNNIDSGDSTITGCTFNCGVAGSANQSGVLHFSSGGLRVANNKFLGGAFGYLMQAQTASTNFSDLFLVGNSIENMLTAGVQFNRGTGTANFGNILINSNEFGQNPNGIIMNDTSGFLVNISIIGNDINTLPGTGTGIIYDHNTNGFFSNNRITGATGSGGVSIGSSAINTHVGINEYSVTVPFSNGSSSTVLDLTMQAGSTSVTTTTAYGSFFIGSTVVTFPAGFHSAPAAFGGTITATGAQALPGVIVTAVTATTMTVSVLSLTNSAVVGVEWWASGIAV